MTESEQRAAVAAEALEWLGTRWEHRARVKGSAVDCAMLLAEVYERACVFPHVDPGEYARDAHLHLFEERLLEEVEQRAVRRPDGEPPQPGDIALFRYGHVLSHAAIVVGGSRVIHSQIRDGVVLDDVESNSGLARHFAGYWDPWGKR